MSRSPHLGENVRAYVDAALDGRALLAFDRHLVACVSCYDAVQRERRLVAALRQGPTPGVSSGLEAMLLSLGATRSEVPGGTRLEAPFPLVTSTLRTVAPASPALHHSPRRSAALAALAAGASAAVAWSLASVAPAASPPRRVVPASASVVEAPSSETTQTTLVFRVGAPVTPLPWAPVGYRAKSWAESTP
jgi:hypothetical protein